MANRSKPGRSDITAYAASLSGLAKWSAGEGVVLSNHHHMGSMIQYAENIVWLMKGSTPDLGLLFDTGHLHFAGADVL